MDSTKSARLTSKFAVHGHALRRRDFGGPLAEIRRWMWSNNQDSGYRCDISTMDTRPEAKVAHTFRPLTEADAVHAFDTTGFSNAEARELEIRRRLYESGLQTCYSAVLDDGPAAGTVVYLCWIFVGKTQRNEVLEFFKDRFLPLADDELLLEGTWTHPDHRNININPACIYDTVMAKATSDTKYIVCYISDDNPASFLAVRKNHFKRFVQRSDTWRFFRSKSTWVETDVELPRPPRPTPKPAAHSA